MQQWSWTFVKWLLRKLAIRLIHYFLSTVKVNSGFRDTCSGVLNRSHMDWHTHRRTHMHKKNTFIMWFLSNLAVCWSNLHCCSCGSPVTSLLRTTTQVPLSCGFSWPLHILSTCSRPRASQDCFHLIVYNRCDLPGLRPHTSAVIIYLLPWEHK